MDNRIKELENRIEKLEEYINGMCMTLLFLFLTIAILFCFGYSSMSDLVKWLISHHETFYH